MITITRRVRRAVYRRIISINSVHAYSEQRGVVARSEEWERRFASAYDLRVLTNKKKNKNNNNLHSYRTPTFMVIV